MTPAFAALVTPLGTVVSYGEVARRVGRAGRPLYDEIDPEEGRHQKQVAQR